MTFVLPVMLVMFGIFAIFTLCVGLVQIPILFVGEVLRQPGEKGKAKLEEDVLRLEVPVDE